MVAQSGACVSAEPCGQLGQRYSAFAGNRNPTFWIEVVGGTLDPKNWIETNRAKPMDSTGALVGDTP